MNDYLSRIDFAVKYKNEMETNWYKITGERIRFMMVNVEQSFNFSMYKDFLNFFSINAKSKKKPQVFYRQSLMYLLHTNFGHKYSFLAKIFALDHTTIMHGVKAIRNAIETNDVEVISIKNKVEKYLTNIF